MLWTEDGSQNAYKTIFDMIEFNQGLTSLTIDSKNFTNNELGYIEEKLSKNCFLTSLNLGKSTKSIIELIERNKFFLETPTIHLKPLCKHWTPANELKSMNEVDVFFHQRPLKFLGICKDPKIADENKRDIFIGKLPKVIIKYIFSFIKIGEAFEIIYPNKFKIALKPTEIVNDDIDDYSQEYDANFVQNGNLFTNLAGEYELMESVDGLNPN